MDINGSFIKQLYVSRNNLLFYLKNAGFDSSCVLNFCISDVDGGLRFAFISSFAFASCIAIFFAALAASSAFSFSVFGLSAVFADAVFVDVAPVPVANGSVVTATGGAPVAGGVPFASVPVPVVPVDVVPVPVPVDADVAPVAAAGVDALVEPPFNDTDSFISKISLNILKYAYSLISI